MDKPLRTTSFFWRFHGHAGAHDVDTPGKMLKVRMPDGRLTDIYGISEAILCDPETMIPEWAVIIETGPPVEYKPATVAGDRQGAPQGIKEDHEEKGNGRIDTTGKEEK